MAEGQVGKSGPCRLAYLNDFAPLGEASILESWPKWKMARPSRKHAPLRGNTDSVLRHTTTLYRYNPASSEQRTALVYIALSGQPVSLALSSCAVCFQGICTINSLARLGHPSLQPSQALPEGTGITEFTAV